MDLATIVLNAAKAAHVSGSLLLAICSHESHNFEWTYTEYDHGSPSVGICMVKEATAKMLGFKGSVSELRKPEVNSKYAAAYLAYQQSRYGEDDWTKLASSYNAGSYVESKKAPGCPRNLKYIRLVQRKLETELKDRLNCGPEKVATN